MGARLRLRASSRRSRSRSSRSRSSGWPAHRGRHRRDDAVGLLVIPYATHPAAGGVVDLLRHADRRARPPAARRGALDLAARAAVHRCGPTCTGCGSSASSCCRLRGPDAGRADADVGAQALGAGDGAARDARRGRSRRRDRRCSSTRCATSTPATGAWRTSPSGSRPTSTIRRTCRCSSSWPPPRSSAAGGSRGG